MTNGKTHTNYPILKFDLMLAFLADKINRNAEEHHNASGSADWIKRTECDF